MNAFNFAIIVLLLGFAGFLAGTEASLNSISRIAVEELVSSKKRGSAWLLKVTSNRIKYLNVVLLVRKACELAATAIVATIALDSFTDRRVALSVTVLGMLIVSYVLVGVGPRTLGRQHPIKWARPGAIVAGALAVVLSPVTRLLIAIGNAITPGKGFRGGPFTTEAEFRDLVNQAREQGFVEDDEHEMIHSVFELGDTLVREVMVPRTEMVYIERDKSLRQALSLALRSGYSRIPVIGDDLDEIIGIAYIKDLAKRTHDFREAEQTEKVEELMRPANFVPENKMADELLREMQSDQIHLAIVVDEYGGTAGLITIEDILEEIVGEIADEYDDGDDSFTWLNEEKTKARAKAALHIEDLAEELEIEIEAQDFEDVDTIGGLMAQKLGRVPITGSTVDLGGWSITSERPIGRRRRISSVLVEKLVEPVADAE